MQKLPNPTSLDQCLRCWEAERLGTKVVTREQMKLSGVHVENARLKMEVAALKSAGILRQRCAIKYAWIDAQRKAYPLPVMYDFL